MTPRDDILSRVREVPALPAAAIEAIELAQDPDVSADRLCRAIEIDPGLTSSVLSMANSVHFRGVGEITSVRDAIVRLGGKTMFHLVVASAVAPVARQEIVGYELPPGELLKHAVCVGVGAEVLAEALGIGAPPHTFTSGVLHDLGKIVMGTYLEIDSEPIRHLAFDEGLSFEVAEGRILGVDHAEVGSALLESWSIPRGIVEVVRWHHQPERFPGEDTLAVDLVHVANIIARMGGLGLGTEGLNYAPSLPVVKRLRITTQVAEKVVNKILSGWDRLAEELHSRVEG